MRAGISASIAAKKRRERQQQQKQKGNKYMVSDEESQLDQEQQNQQQIGELINSKIFQVAQVPVGVWLVGFCMIILGIYFISVLASQDKSASIKGFDQGFWWQYLICGCVSLLGLSFILVKKIEKITINKEKGLILMRQRNVFCIKSDIVKPINTLTDIFIIKRGHESVMNKTAHFVISLHFTLDSKNIEILENNSFKKTKKRFIAIRQFLGMTTDAQHIGIIDESTKS